MITVSNVWMNFPGKTVLAEINLTVQKGEFVSLIGPSGCGKTTLLRIIAGLLKPTKGLVSIDGESPKKACQQHLLGYASQSPALLPHRTALENVGLTLEITGQNHDSYQPRELLRLFGLENAMNQHPHQLSGGMRQRTTIATAMVHKPPVMLMDEPFGALDDITRNMLGDWFAQVLLSSGQTVVFVTHSIREAVFLSDRVVFMSPRGDLCSSLLIKLPRPRLRGLRNEADFSQLVAQAGRLLDEATELEIGGTHV